MEGKTMENTYVIEVKEEERLEIIDFNWYNIDILDFSHPK